jgi:hypothetical protein
MHPRTKGRSVLVRLIWALIFVLVLSVFALIGAYPGGRPPNQDPSVGAALRACASNPQAPSCR